MYDVYTTFDDPIPYWQHNIKFEDRNDNNKLLFYPVMIRDIFKFYSYSGCLVTDHQSIPDPKILSMTCYQYLYYCTLNTPETTPYIYMFDLLLSLVLKDEKLESNNWSSRYECVDGLGKPAFMIGEILYDSEDFDNIKELIANQNDLELPDVKKSKEFRDAVELAKKRRAKILGSGSKMGSLEEQLICLSLGYGLSYNEVENISLRKFNKMIRYMDKKMHYEIYMQASMSGFVTFKEKIEHWMSAEDNDRYKEVITDTDQLSNTLSGKNPN